MNIPFIVFQNFLGARDNQAALNCIKNLEHKFTRSTLNKNGVETINLNIKKNKNLWLNQINNYELELTEFLARYIFNKKLLQVLENYTDLLHTDNHTTGQYSILLSKYESGDFYDWHTDLDGFVTWSYVCYNNSVEGGEFQLSNATADQERQDIETIPCVNDMLIIFPARYQHRVMPIISGCRYSLQLFFNYKCPTN